MKVISIPCCFNIVSWDIPLTPDSSEPVADSVLEPFATLTHTQASTRLRWHAHRWRKSHCNHVQSHPKDLYNLPMHKMHLAPVVHYPSVAFCTPVSPAEVTSLRWIFGMWFYVFLVKLYPRSLLHQDLDHLGRQARCRIITRMPKSYWVGLTCLSIEQDSLLLACILQAHSLHSPAASDENTPATWRPKEARKHAAKVCG